MNIKPLVNNDLNLLVTLLVLLEERNVSRAAERLFLSQPAISKALSRLREAFNDPLFTRASRGLVPTPFALSLHEPLNQAVSQLAVLYLPETFDPSSYRGELVLAVTESIDMSFIPYLMKDLASQAPGLVLHTCSHYADQLKGLESGEIDFVISLEYQGLTDSFNSQLLFTDRPVMMVREGHPLAGTECSLEELLSYRRLVVQLPDMDKYAFHELSREAGIDLRGWKTGFETENLVTALAALSAADWVLPGVEFVLNHAMSSFSLSSVKVREQSSVLFNYCLTSHKRIEGSPVHQWLTELITEKAVDVHNFLLSKKTKGN